MATDLHSIAVRDTEAALRGIASDLPGDLPRVIERPESLQTPLARVGDALRLGLEVPRPVRKWLGELSLEQLKAVLASVTDETRSWSLPMEPIGEADDPLLATVVRRRDEAESVRAAVRRSAQPRGAFAHDWPEYVALEMALAHMDHMIRRVVTRLRVTELLGARVALRSTWTDAFDDEPSEEEHPSEEIDLPPGVLSSAPLRDEDVARYVKRGALSRLVEGVAADNALFADELAACIDGLIKAREEVGFVARKWRKSAPFHAEEDPLVLPFVPATRLAAATTEVGPSEPTLVHLGALSPLDAEARVELTPHEVIFTVFQGDAPLTRVEVGSGVCTSSDEAGSWRVRLPLSPGSVLFRVIAADGREFASEIGFSAARPSDEAR